MLFKRYSGSFVNCKGQTWRVEIWQAANAPFTTVGSLTFDADTPLELEWEEREKYETTCGATLTINIVSPADRTFTDLFQISPGNVMAHVYLDDALFWVGGLDCETYEEPYQSEKDYTVTLTFTDFGHMQRLKYGETGGVKSVRHYIDYCLEQVGLSAVPVEVFTSLEMNDSVLWESCDLTRLYVDAANFYDEDGEASTLDEVLNGVLQPLALRIVQRAGKIMVYDLNALRNNPPKVEEITWDATEQTLSVDKLAQAAVVKFSPYTGGDLLSDSSVTIKQDRLTEVGSVFNMFGPGFKTYEISRFFHSASDSAATGLTQKHPDAHYFKMVKTGTGGAACEGLAWLALTNCWPRNNLTLNGQQSPLGRDTKYAYVEANTNENVITRAFNDLSGTSDEVLMRFPRVYCPAAQHQVSEDVMRSYIHLTMEMMIDPRLNPFADAEDETNEKDNFNWCKVREAYCYIPFSLVLFDGNGKAIAQYQAKGAGTNNEGHWVAVEYDDTKYFTHAPSYLLYYANSKSDSLKEESGIQGWSKNHTHTLGHERSIEQYATEGEIIPLPNTAGYLELTIYTGCIIFDDRDGKGKEYPITNPQTCQLDKSLPDPNGLRDVCISTQTSKRGQRMNWAQRWWLYKFPKLEIVQGLIAEAVEKSDAEYSAWVNASAKDEIKIDTICGTAFGSDLGVTARGAYKIWYSFAPSGSGQTEIPQRCFLRRTNTSAPWLIEYDLLGLLFSQYGHRVPTLEGEAITPLSPLQLFTDRAMPSEDLFMMKSEVLSAYDGTSNIKFVRLEREEWNKEIIK